eukprot:sb/3464134/
MYTPSNQRQFSGYLRYLKAECQRSVCGKCKVETEKRPAAIPQILCRVCSEYREIWKKSNAWFFHAIPKYVVPPKIPKQPLLKNSPIANKAMMERRLKDGSFTPPEYSSSTSEEETEDSDSDISEDSETEEEHEDAEGDGTSLSAGLPCEEDQVMDIIESEEFKTEDNDADLETGECGAIKFSLQYDPIEQMLNVNIFSGHKLKPMDVGGTSDPYVKCNLIPGRLKATKLKTSRKECDLNPVFNEKLTYHGIFDSDINTKCLKLTVLDYDRMTKNDKIGIATVSLAGLEPQQKHHFREVLREEKEEEERGMDGAAGASGDPGRIKLSLHLQNGELKVSILKCSMLMAPGCDALPNPIVKINIKPSAKRNLYKRKTDVLKKTSNPEFGPKACFTYDISNIDIESPDRCLEVGVWDCHFKRQTLIGGVVLGKESSGNARSHWMDALSSCGHRVTRWHILEGHSEHNVFLNDHQSSVELPDQPASGTSGGTTYNHENI